MEKIKTALVIPTHSDVHSSLHNLLKVYRYLIKNKNVEATIFTDKKNNVSYRDAEYRNFKIQKINGIDYKTILEKVLLVLGIPRFYYTDLIKKLKGYDVIESSNPEFYIFAYQAYKAAKKFNSRLIYRTSQTVDGFYLFKLTKYIIIPIVRKSYEHAKFLLFSNPQAEKRCIRLGIIKNKEKSIIIGHAVDTECFKPLKTQKKTQKPQKHKSTILLSVGGLYKIKGHHLIIEAMAKLIEKGYAAELWIVGEGYYKNTLIELAKRLGIEYNVKFLGKKPHAELAGIYNESDIFVLANYQEITPAVNEAMACGKPVVAMECGGSNFVIPNEKYGLIAKRFNVNDLADKILYLIKNKKKAKIIAKRARKHIMKNFSIEKVALKLYSAFTL